MVKFTIDELKSIMSNTHNIRNMSVIAHVDHGKSTLTDSLLAKAGIISEKQAGQARATDTQKEEIERGITIKSTGVSMYYETKSQKNNLVQQQQIQEQEEVKENNEQQNQKYLFNLIDSPGHVDFSSEVTAALRVTDGALVIVDSIEGVCVQTETVLRQACQERIKSALVINKLDRSILEKKMDGEDIYQSFQKTIAKVNEILSTYLPDNLQEQWEVDVVKGNIAFAAGKDCWGFTVPQIAQQLSKKLKVDENVLCKKLWGNNFYDPVSKKWKKEPYNDKGERLERGFVKFILNPIINVHKKIVEEEDFKFAVQKAQQYNFEINQDDEKLQPKKLLKTFMSRWLNAGEAMFEMMVQHLPSPVEAMRYRTEILYTGPQDDEIAQSMRYSNQDGPLIMYVSKMIPNNDFSKFYAFGRVFSGTLKEGSKVLIMGPNYEVGKKDDLYQKNITMPVLMMGKNVENISNVPAGNTCALVGIDNYLVKTGTIASHPESHTIKSMKYSVSPVVRVAVQPKSQADIVKLINGLKKLSKYDGLVQCQIDETTGQNIIAGSGELHIEICLNLLKNEFAKCEIVVSEPIVNYKETILGSSLQGLSKSSNGHNRLFGTVEPVDDKLCEQIENEKVVLEKVGTDKFKNMTEKLVEEFDWDREHVKKIWTFGPLPNDSNILVDTCSQVQGLNNIKDSIVQAFKLSTQEGVLTHETTRGIRVNLQDAKIHSDPVHRGTSQILPMTRSLIYGNCLNAQPGLLEPIFLCEITVPQEAKNGVYNLLNKRRGHVFNEDVDPNTPLSYLQAYLPVEESFGFTEALRQATQGQAFPQCVMSHWQVVQGSLDDSSSRLSKIVNQIRKRKGLNSVLPVADDYLKKL